MFEKNAEYREMKTVLSMDKKSLRPLVVRAAD